MGAAHDDRPNILVFGVGHSGTTLLSRMLFALGWNPGETPDAADEQFGEHQRLRECNEHVLAHQSLPADAEAIVRSLKSPWAVKDPRFVITLPQWLPVFRDVLDRWPVLLWITRDLEQVKQSYAKRGGFVRGQLGAHGLTLESLCQLAETHYANWPDSRLPLSYSQLVTAAALWLPERTQGGVDLIHRQENRELLRLQEVFEQRSGKSQATIETLRDKLRQHEAQVAALQARLGESARHGELQTKTINHQNESLRQQAARIEDLQRQLGQPRGPS